MLARAHTCRDSVAYLAGGQAQSVRHDGPAAAGRLIDQMCHPVTGTGKLIQRTQRQRAEKNFSPAHLADKTQLDPGALFRHFEERIGNCRMAADSCDDLFAVWALAMAYGTSSHVSVVMAAGQHVSLQDRMEQRKQAFLGAVVTLNLAPETTCAHVRHVIFSDHKPAWSWHNAFDHHLAWARRPVHHHNSFFSDNNLITAVKKPTLVRALFEKGRAKVLELRLKAMAYLPRADVLRLARLYRRFAVLNIAPSWYRNFQFYNETVDADFICFKAPALQDSAP